MDGCSSKRGVATNRAPTKGCNIGSRDARSNRDQNVHFCNRRGCNGRIKYVNQNMKPEGYEKAKSSKSGSMMTREKSSSHLDSKRKLSSQLGFDQSESSQSGDSEDVSSPDRSRISHRSGSKNIAEQVLKNGSVASSVRSRKKIQSTLGSSKQNTITASAVSPTPKSSGLRTLNTSNRSSCPKNLKCNSTSDASPLSCSSSASMSSTRDVMKKRSLEGESSVSNRVRQTTAAAMSSGRVSSSTSASTRSSSCTSGVGSSVSPSARTGGSANASKSRMRLSHRQNGRNIRESEPPRTVRRARLPHLLSATPSSSGSSSNDDSQSMYSRLMNSEFLQGYNMDDIDEVLLGLELDGGMTHEQILALETSLFLSGLNLYDQHRDMRLDIDDMSYEELLALGDRMGTVSTALSEEELLKCVKRSVYEATPPEVVVCKEAGEDGDDVKCSICQEEYVEGDEIGEMVECHHAYHVDCVNQWLRRKNWCPICKTAAAAPP